MVAKKVNETKSESIEKEFLDETLDMASPELEEKVVKNLKKIPETATIEFRKAKEQELPLEFFYEDLNEGIPRTKYSLAHGKVYTLPVKVIENIEERADILPRTIINAEGNPETVNDQKNYLYTCRPVRGNKK